MNVFEQLIENHRDMLKQVSDLRRRMNAMIVTGTVKERQGPRVRLEFSENDPHTGGPFESPMVPIMRPSGRNGGGHSMFTKPGIGESMLMISPGGEIGEHSRAIHAGHVDDHPAPGTSEADGEVHTVGNVKIEIKDGLIKFGVGGTTFEFSAGGFKQTGGAIEHDGKKIDKTHKHLDVEPGGGSSGVPE